MDRRALLGSMAAASMVGLDATTMQIESPRSILGAFPGASPADPQQINPFERWLGTRFGVVVLYVNADVPVSVRNSFLEGMTRVWQTGHVPIVTWLPYIGDEDTTPATITRQVRDGEYDDVIDWWTDALSAWLWADDAVTGGPRRLYFRPFPEMNGDWLPWSVLESGDETAFIDAWRYVHELLMDEIGSADRIQWLWNPNATEHGAVPTEACYPGDAYVDWIGIDGYNWGDVRAASGWQSPAEVFEPMRSRLVEIADKPLSIPEFGTTSRKDGEWNVAAKRDWIREVFAYLETNDVRMHCWFNIDKETDWAVFDGDRGTGTYEDEDGRQYAVYDAFRTGVVNGTFVGGNLERSGILPTDVFQGRFAG